jgi:excinuclease ABC subunit B
LQYNKIHGIIPKGITKEVKDIREGFRDEEIVVPAITQINSLIPPEELPFVIEDLERQMKQAAKNLEFEKAAQMRDAVYKLKGIGFGSSF